MASKSKAWGGALQLGNSDWGIPSLWSTKEGHL
jgi:hypothetical protein